MNVPVYEQEYDGMARMQNAEIRQVTKAGIFCGTLRHKAASRTGWRLSFWVNNKSLTADEIKEIVSTYIQGSFDGVNIQFWRGESNGLYATFDIGKG